MCDAQNSDAPIELSDAELAEISGGIDFTFSMMIVQKTDSISIQESSSEIGSSTSMTRSSRFSAFLFQYSGSGMEAWNEMFTMLSSFFQFFRR